MTSIVDIVSPPATLPPTNSLVIDAVAPTTPVDGDLWFDTTANQLHRWDGATWAVVSSSSAGASLPAATAEGQVLTSGPSPTFTWYPDYIDAGRI